MDDQIISHKRCTKCGKVFPATTEYFSRHSEGKYGLRPDCKLCVSARDKQKRALNPDVNKEQCKTYYRTHKKERGEYNRQYRLNHPNQRKKSDREYRQRYKHERTKYNQQWVKDHPEIVKPRRKYYYHLNIETSREQGRKDANTRRARKHAAIGYHTSTDIDILYINQRGLCAYCSTPLHGKYHVDHIVPLSRGGTDYAENLTLTCPRCNLSKGDKLLSEWKR